MKRKTRLLIGAAIILPLGLGLWARSAASWRPQKIGTFPNAFLVKDVIHGPWVYESNNRVLNLENGSQIAIPIDRYQIRVSPDSHSFVVSVEDNLGKIRSFEWRDCQSGKILRRLNKLLGHHKVVDFQYSPDGTQLRILMTDGVGIMPLNGSQASFSPLPIPASDDSQSLSPDGKWVCSVSEYTTSKQITIYDVKTLNVYRTIHHEHSFASQSSFSPDSSLLCVEDYDDPLGKGEMCVCDVKSGHKLWNSNQNYQQTYFEFSPDSQTVLIFDANGSKAPFGLYGARTGKLLREFKFTKLLSQAAFSSDGDFIFALDINRTVWKIRVR
ncbi:hypothetical protein IAD21_04830 [Abditibacteriota bacterium]|nr:hypothetical protein IAD21_04830 [Abditibacteriota bacterium]